MSRVDGNLYVDGTLSTKELVPSAGSVSNSHVDGGANIAASKVIHRNKVHYSQQVAVDAANDARVVYVVNAAGGATLRFFGAGSIVVAGAATTLTVDLQKNGTTILTAPLVLDNGNAIRTLEEPAGYTSTALVDNDVLTIHFTLSGSNEATGVFALLEVDEYPN